MTLTFPTIPGGRVGIAPDELAPKANKASAKLPGSKKAVMQAFLRREELSKCLNGLRLGFPGNVDNGELGWVLKFDLVF